MGTTDIPFVIRASTSRHEHTSGWTKLGPIVSRSNDAIWTQAQTSRLFGSVAADCPPEWMQEKQEAPAPQPPTVEVTEVTDVRFTGGATSFLEVLTTQQQYFSSELQTTQAWFSELQNYVQLYQALGGGW